MTPIARSLRIAVAWMTRIPAHVDEPTEAELALAPAFFPVIGLFVGLVGALVFLATRTAGVFVASVLSLAATVMLTGALHEDGLADTADALGGAREPARVRAILKDSRVGSYGAAALVLVLLAKVGLVAELADRVLFVLPLAHAVGRLVSVAVMAALPYASDPERAKSGHLPRPTVRLAQAAALGPALLLVGGIAVGLVGAGRALALLVALTAVTSLAIAWFRARLGGYTGDLLGAAEQLGEGTTLLVLALGTVP